MKKFVFAFMVSSLFFLFSVEAQSDDGLALPESAQIDLSVANISRDNADATQVANRAGDVLRYELKISSEIDDINEFYAMFDIRQLTEAAELVNIDNGEIFDGMLGFSPFSQAAPCEKVFSFFARIKDDCGNLDEITVSTPEKSVTVPVSCDLVETGPNSFGFHLVFILAVVTGIIFFAIRQQRLS